MLFNSYQFFIFFPIVTVLYYVIPNRCKIYWLLITSYYFYMSWNPKYAVLIFVCTGITWGGGIIIEHFKGRSRKAILTLVIAFPLMILFIFKYLDFVWENLQNAAEKIGVTMGGCPWSYALPVGISFYTFQAIGYVIDVYRGNVKAERSLLRFATFVSFFPQLVAGPIERSSNLLHQIDHVGEKRSVDWNKVRDGLIYMLYGYFVKMVVADNLSVYVDEIYKRYYFYGSVELIIAAVFFSIQIYCDFSGYSAIAIGAAQVMGFELMENFHAPYFATSIKDFWRRWHISLSTWLKDYVYIPLGGNRCSRIRRYFNLMLTFLISGLWHGANWTYVLWGGMHGLCQISGELTMPVREKVADIIGINRSESGYEHMRMIMTFVLTTVAWILFRAESIGQAVQYISSMVTKWNPWVLTDGSIKTVGFYNGVEYIVVLGAVAFMLRIDHILEKKKQRIDVYLEKQGNFFRMLFVVGIIFSIVMFGNYGGYQANAFIYFQF